MQAALDKLALEFRSAVMGGDHALAAKLADDYAGALAKVWETMTESERAASSIPKQASELLTWAHQMTVVQRAIAGTQLAIIEKASHYNMAPSDESSGTGVQFSAHL